MWSGMYRPRPPRVSPIFSAPGSWPFCRSWDSGVLLIAVLAASSVVAALGRLVPDDLALLAPLLQWLSPLAMLALFTVVFALVFRVLPEAEIPWSPIWRGAAFTSVLFTIGTFLLGLYLGSGAIGHGFGAAAALVTLLLFAYYSAQIFLLGAEFTRVLHLEMPDQDFDQPIAAALPEPSPVDGLPARRR